MTRRLITATGLLVVTVALAACGSGGSASTNAAANGGNAATVSTKQIDGAGTVLVDPAGKALYASDQEAGGMVLCTGACNSFWTPLTVSAGPPTGASIGGTLGTVQRPDGARQVTYDGKLLYTFKLDDPGKVAGVGFKDAFDGKKFTWHVVHQNGTPSSSGGSTQSNGSYGY
jgi:predicted lipoprotein with Yx(FWY)xxD motif